MSSSSMLAAEEEEEDDDDDDDWESGGVHFHQNLRRTGPSAAEPSGKPRQPVPLMLLAPNSWRAAATTTTTTTTTLS